MTKTLVLGYGSELRGDDSIGLRVAEALADSVVDPDVEIVACGQLTPDLAEAVSRCQRVVFVDASAEDPPGHISCRRIYPREGGALSLSHELDPQSLLVWTRELFGQEPEAVLCTMGGECFDLTEQLSPVVVETLPALAECVRKQIVQSLARSITNPDPKLFD